MPVVPTVEQAEQNLAEVTAALTNALVAGRCSEQLEELRAEKAAAAVALEEARLAAKGREEFAAAREAQHEAEQLEEARREAVKAVERIELYCADLTLALRDAARARYQIRAAVENLPALAKAKIAGLDPVALLNEFGCRTHDELVSSGFAELPSLGRTHGGLGSFVGQLRKAVGLTVPEVPSEREAGADTEAKADSALASLPPVRGDASKRGRPRKPRTPSKPGGGGGAGAEA